MAIFYSTRGKIGRTRGKGRERRRDAEARDRLAATLGSGFSAFNFFNVFDLFNNFSAGVVVNA